MLDELSMHFLGRLFAAVMVAAEPEIEWYFRVAVVAVEVAVMDMVEKGADVKQILTLKPDHLVT